MIESIIYSNTLDGQVNKDGWSLENFGKGSISQGRMWVYLPHHPRSSSTGQQPRAWAAYELYHGVKLNKGDVIHHKNGDPLDDSFGNLERTTRGGHNTTHFNTSVKCKCKNCGKTFYVKRSKVRLGRGKYCSRECLFKHKGFVKSEHTKSERKCDFCGKDFIYYTAVDRQGYQRRFCSYKCFNLNRRDSEHTTSVSRKEITAQA